MIFAKMTDQIITVLMDFSIRNRYGIPDLSNADGKHRAATGMS